MRSLTAALALLASLPACANDSCFVADTLVATPDGARRIADLEVGDLVYSVTGDGELVAREVTAVRRSFAATVCRVSLDDTVLTGVTPSHPFYDATRDAYVPLRDLKPDTELRVLHDGALVPARLTDIAITEHVAPSVEVYDLTVQGPEHNFLAEGVLVHNKEDHTTLGTCGDGVDDGEQCDDGNNLNGDGCDSLCRLEQTPTTVSSSGATSSSSSSTTGTGGDRGTGGAGGAGGMGAGGAGIGGSGGS